MDLKNVEMKIWYFEGFRVRLVEIEGGSRDVRRNRRNVGNYNFKRRAKNNLTVKEFMGARLKQFEQYGWAGQVISGDGSTAHDHTSLESVRASYSTMRFHANGLPDILSTFRCQVRTNDPV